MEDKDTALVWFRDDLRVTDHEGLARARARHKHVVATYILNPNYSERDSWGFRVVGQHRIQFLLETLENLSYDLEQLGIPLLMYEGASADVLTEIIQVEDVQTIYAQKSIVGPDLSDEADAIASVGKAARFEFYSGQFLTHPDDIPFGLADFPSSFAEFRKVIEWKSEPRELIDLPNDPADKTANGLFEVAETPAPFAFKGSKPSDHRPNIDERSAFPFRGGETNARYRLDHYFWNTKFVTRYKETRNNLVGLDCSTKFSPWFANGSLSPRYVYHEIKRFEKKVVQNTSTYWVIFEMLWRDYYRYLALVHGDSFFSARGIADRPYGFSSNPDAIRKWITGSTGEPFVDANMIELLRTGWMSRVGRKVVASYFCNELGQDWRIGAAWFASQLIDHDTALNYGNWMTIAGVGDDPDNHVWLNPRAQAIRHDPNREYQNLWLTPSIESTENGRIPVIDYDQ